MKIICNFFSLALIVLASLFFAGCSNLSQTETTAEHTLNESTTLDTTVRTFVEPYIYPYTKKAYSFAKINILKVYDDYLYKDVKNNFMVSEESETLRFVRFDAEIIEDYYGKHSAEDKVTFILSWNSNEYLDDSVEKFKNFLNEADFFYAYFQSFERDSDFYKIQNSSIDGEYSEIKFKCETFPLRLYNAELLPALNGKLDGDMLVEFNKEVTDEMGYYYANTEGALKAFERDFNGKLYYSDIPCEEFEQNLKNFYENNFSIGDTNYIAAE